MMAQSRAESTRDTYNYGQYINQFPSNTIKVIREFERIQKKICRHKMSTMFNEICIYIYIYIYIKEERKEEINPETLGWKEGEIHRLHLCWCVWPHLNVWPSYDTKSDGEIPELWRMQSTPSLQSLPGPLWPEVVAPITGSNRTKLCTSAKLNCLK